MGLRGAAPADKFMLWLDAVGGFLVCVAEDVVLGQPSQEGRADVPILADLSARHARIRRDGENYLIEALGERRREGVGVNPGNGSERASRLRPVRINGQPIQQICALADGSRIELGEAVRLTFRQPHPLSASARLEFASRHRTQPSSDGVLLLADSCVLGPRSHSHVVCRDWPREVILFRHEDEWFCRAPGWFQIDGVAHRDRGRVRRNSRVTGEGFAFSLDPMEG